MRPLVRSPDKSRQHKCIWKATFNDALLEAAKGNAHWSFQYEPSARSRGGTLLLAGVTLDEIID